MLWSPQDCLSDLDCGGPGNKPYCNVATGQCVVRGQGGWAAAAAGCCTQPGLLGARQTLVALDDSQRQILWPVLVFGGGDLEWAGRGGLLQGPASANRLFSLCPPPLCAGVHCGCQLQQVWGHVQMQPGQERNELSNLRGERHPVLRLSLWPLEQPPSNFALEHALSLQEGQVVPLNLCPPTFATAPLLLLHGSLPCLPWQCGSNRSHCAPQNP